MSKNEKPNELIDIIFNNWKERINSCPPNNLLKKISLFIEDDVLLLLKEFKINPEQFISNINSYALLKLWSNTILEIFYRHDKNNRIIVEKILIWVLLYGKTIFPESEAYNKIEQLGNYLNETQW